MMTLTQHNTTLHYWLAAQRLTGIGPVTMMECIEHFGDIQRFFSASRDELAVLGFTHHQIREIQQPPWSQIEKDLSWCQQHDCDLICRDDSRYPPLLKQCHDAPLVLFVRGNVGLLHQPQLAIVGSRHPTVYGREIAEQFAQHLSKTGFVVTSGLALGIDAASHKGALAGGGKTIAVLGSGHARVYPLSHRTLADHIIAHGALVTEFAPHEPPRAYHFPQRNRIISGLSLGVLVVEAAVKSGSLITARFAVEQGREVFAIPGSIHNPLSKGCHALMREGAKIVETAQDILEELSALFVFATSTVEAQEKRELKKCDEKSMRLLAEMAYEVTPLDVIILRSGLTASEVSSMLLSLEILGYVRRVPGGYARLINV